MDSGFPGRGGAGRGDRGGSLAGQAHPARLGRALAPHPALDTFEGPGLRPKKIRITGLYTYPPVGSTVICADELGPVNPGPSHPHLPGHRTGAGSKRSSTRAAVGGRLRDAESRGNLAHRQVSCASGPRPAGCGPPTAGSTTDRACNVAPEGLAQVRETTTRCSC